MLPADTIAEITTAIAALHLEPNLAAQILAAVFAPLLRNSPAPLTLPDPGPPERRHRRKRAGRPRARGGRKRKYKRRVPPKTEARERALAALKANPGETVSAVAKLAKVSFGTVINARKDLAKEARKEARRKAKATDVGPDPRHQRAQRFLKGALANGPRPVSDIETEAAKAHVDIPALESARGALGIITSRASAGAQAVQWSLPG